jgi:hypothetical protein
MADILGERPEIQKVGKVALSCRARPGGFMHLLEPIGDPRSKCNALSKSSLNGKPLASYTSAGVRGPVALHRVFALFFIQIMSTVGTPPEDSGGGKFDPEVLKGFEAWWRDQQLWLKERGYMLRPRYRADWVPSWKGTNKIWIQCEDGRMYTVSAPSSP